MPQATPATRPQILRHQLRRSRRVAILTALDHALNPPSPNQLPADWHHIDNSTRVQQWYARSGKQ